MVGSLVSWLEALAHVLNFAVSFGLVTVLFALIYKIIPRVEVAWHDVWVGAAVTSLLFTIGKFLISLYLGKSDVGSSFGAAGSLVIVMVWVYYSSQIFRRGRVHLGVCPRARVPQRCAAPRGAGQGRRKPS